MRANPLEGRRILLGVTGGIAAYKAAALLRLFVQAGAEVRVVMTEAATKLVAPLTFEVLSNGPVGVDMWKKEASTRIQHTDLGRDSDLIVIAPATANTIGRIVGGLADNLLTSLVMASRTPVLLAPAMNVEMWNNPLVQHNLARLVALGRYHVVPPTSGELACGVEGEGRLAPLETIVDHAGRLLTPDDLAGLSVLVTAGPTQEAIDPVRMLTNRSSGHMGYALAAAAWQRGAAVTLISGPTALDCPTGVWRRDVVSAADMREAVLEELPEADVLAMVAAVADYRPAERAASKLKKGVGGRSLDLVRTNDILSEVGRLKSDRPLVLGFAAETDDVEENARDKMRRKKVDLIFANRVGDSDGFGDRHNAGLLLDRWGGRRRLPLADKASIAHGILDRIAALEGGESANGAQLESGEDA